MRLTKTAIAELVPGKSTIAKWDDQTRGFGYRLYPSGKGAFVVRYRLPGSRHQHVVVIGAPGEMSIDQARTIAAKHLTAAREGRDLLAETAEQVRQSEEEAQAKAERATVREAVESYMSWFESSEVARTGKPRAPASIRAEGSWTAHLMTAYADKALADVTAGDIRRLIDKLPAGSRNAVHGAVGRVMKWAGRYEVIDTGAIPKVETPPRPSPRERTPTVAEVREYLAVIERLRESGALRQSSADYLSLIALTGQRRHEVALMRWEDLDLQACEWRQPSTSNKSKRPHVVPLGPRAMSIINRRVADGGRKNALVVPGANGGGPQHGNACNLMERVQAEDVDFNLHDLRRAMVSAMADHGVPMEVADSLLNHAAAQTRGGITGVYQKAELREPKRRAMLVWEGLLLDQRADVVPLRRETA
jgi:integrase